MVMIRLPIMGVAILSIMLMVINKFHDKDADGRYRQHAYSNATNATCDAEPLEPLAAHFFDEPCVAALTCDDQAMLAQFMCQFLSPLRAEAILFCQAYLLTNFMVVHEGGGYSVGA